MLNPPPLVRNDQQAKDNEHLRLLSIFHFIFVGVMLLGIGFIFLHYFIMRSIFLNPEFWKGQKNANPPPPELLDIFLIIYIVAGIAAVAACVLNLLSGIFLRQRKHRIFSMVVAGLDCIQIPLGTALGVFTIIVLARDSVRQLYHAPAR